MVAQAAEIQAVETREASRPVSGAAPEDLILEMVLIREGLPPVRPVEALLVEMGEAQQVVALVQALPTVVHRQVQGEALATPERLVKQAAPVEQPVRGGE